MENEQFVNNEAPHSSLLAMLIWSLTSITLGTGWFFYSVLFEDNGDVWAGVPVTIAAAVLSLPVLLVLCIVIPFIKNLSRSTVNKIKRLMLSCFTCTLPYSLLIGIFPVGKYSYPLYVLAVSGILFACSIVAMLITSRIIKQIFVAEPAYTFSVEPVNYVMDNDQVLVVSKE
ncbi:MAG: hypothetical protein ABJB86_06655 [Bacteroidota bacterium]